MVVGQESDMNVYVARLATKFFVLSAASLASSSTHFASKQTQCRSHYLWQMGDIISFSCFLALRTVFFEDLKDCYAALFSLTCFKRGFSSFLSPNSASFLS